MALGAFGVVCCGCGFTPTNNSYLSHWKTPEARKAQDGVCCVLGS